MSNEKTIKPPYCSSGHAEALIDLFRRQTPTSIDSRFIADNGITTPPNAPNVLKLAQWFGLINENGDVITEKITKLKLVGEERDQYVKQLVMDSYRDLFQKVHLENAKRSDVINYFITNYGYGSSAAENSATLFLYFCNKYTIPLSDELKRTPGVRPTTPRRQKTPATKTKDDKSVEETVAPSVNREGSGIEIVVKSFGIEANPHTSIIARTPEELDEKLNTEFKAFMEYVKVLLKVTNSSLAS